MAKKKGDSASSKGTNAGTKPNGSAPMGTKLKTKASDASSHSSSLTISRNKHWRYISAFHGPWLQLPSEILETLTHSNYLSPRPRQTDPSVLFDLLKVRKLVDEAADLAVRAQNGTASSALNAENGLPGAALGLNTRGGAGGNAKLSPERKFRMRELATVKLSQAYRLDEVAASVATMQGASALDTVASLVLQRAPHNTDAQYVHFFHEKIPSRMMAECTSLDPLNEIISRGPGHAAPYRTRALTRIFKEDSAGAAKDLTEALLICHNEQAKYVAGKNQLVTQRQAREDADRRKIWTKDWMSENRVLEEDQPKGLEMQLLFQRGNQYLTIASSHMKKALESFRKAGALQEERRIRFASMHDHYEDEQPADAASPAEAEVYNRGVESRESGRRFAKRALRDYTTFLSRLDYAVATDPGATDVFHRGRVLGEDDMSEGSMRSSSSQALVTRHRQPSDDLDAEFQSLRTRDSTIIMHDMATLLSSKPPDDIPPFPPSSSSPAIRLDGHSHAESEGDSSHAHEMLTYHPLLPETLHSFLLTHSLLQTPPTTLHRIANNAARLARLADGYPFFLSARSPARADWAEILRQTKNWIGLACSWDSLCKSDAAEQEPSGNNKASKAAGVSKDARNKVPSSQHPHPTDETQEQRRDRIHKEAVMDALGDERVVDDESFQKAVKARERRALRESDPAHLSERFNGVGVNGAQPNGSGSGKNTGTLTASDFTQDSLEQSRHGGNSARSVSPVAKDEEYLIGTERAACIASWIREAPGNPSPMGDVEPKPKRKKKAAGKRAMLSHQSSDVSTLTEATTAE